MELFTTEFTITLSSATDIWFISLNTFRTRVQMTGAENTKAFFSFPTRAAGQLWNTKQDRVSGF